MAKRRKLSVACLALLVLVLVALSVGDSSPGFASLGGLQNPGFEAGLSPWIVTAADAGLVVGTESAVQCPTYADMGVASVVPFKGARSLRLGTCRNINQSQPKGANKASQTFTAVDSRLRLAFRLYSWEHRGYDQFSFELKSGATSVGTLADAVTVPMAGVPGGHQTCSGALPCKFNIDAGKSGQFVATDWITVAIDIPQSLIGQTLTLSYSVAGGKDNGFATWAYFDNVNTPPVAEFTFESFAQILEGDVVQFTDSSFDPDQPDDHIVSWEWLINGETFTEQNPISIFPDEGAYTACLKVTDAFGDTNQVCAGGTTSDGTPISALTLDNSNPFVNALNIEALSGESASLFGRVLEPGWEDVLAATWDVDGDPPAAVQADNLAFLSTGIITGQLTTTSNLSGALTITDGDGGSASDPFQVTLVPNNSQRHEPADNALSTAPVLVSDATHLSWIQSVGDEDFFEARLAGGQMLPAGGELLVKLRGPVETGLNADYDLVILAQLPGAVGGFSSGDSGQTSFNTLGFRDGGFRDGGFRDGGFRDGGFRDGGFRDGGFRDGGFRDGSATYPLSQVGFNGLEGEEIGGADITLDELGLGTPEGNVSVAAYSANLGTGEEVALARSDVAGTEFFIGVVGANGAFSADQPYTLQIETYVPPDPIVALGPEVCLKSPLVGADPANPPTSAVVDLNPGFPAAGTAKTLIVTQRERIIALADDPDTSAVNEGVAAWNTLATKLQALAQHPAVMADVISMPSVFYDDWDTNPCDVAQANAVAAAIKGQIQARLSLEPEPGIQYVVIAGDDDVIPQRRVPDETIIGNEAHYLLDAFLQPGSPLFSSLLGGFILTDDYYVDTVPTPWQGRELYIPDRPIGRLAETPEEIGAAADAFLASNGLLDYSTAASASALVTGYDFFSDGANVMAANLATKLNVTTLINDSWTADDLRCHLLGQFSGSLSGCSIPSVAAVNAHFLHYASLSANGFGTDNFADILNSNELATAVGASPALERRVVFTMGCHPGFNVPDRAALPPDPGLGLDPSLDFVQAMARQRAVFIASTGYGYGDDQGLGGTELLLTIFSGELVDGNVVIGDAFKTAKHLFLLGLSSMTVYDEKSSIQATMFGLPMYQVQVPAGPGSIAAAQPAQAQETFTVTVQDGANVTTFTPAKEEVISPQGHYFTAGGDAQVTAFRPIQPRLVIPLPAGNPAQGVIIKGGTYTEIAAFDPVISLPSDEWLVTPSEPQTCLDAFWPSVPVTLNSLDPGGGGPQALVVTPGQFRCSSGTAPNVTGVQRLYSSLTIEVLHSDTSDLEPPVVSSVDISQPTPSTWAVTVQASDESGIAKIVLIKQSGGVITPVELTLPQPLPTTGAFTLTVPNVLLTDDIAGQVIDGADNVSYFTAKGANGFTFLPVDAGPDQYVTPGTPTTFTITVADFSTLNEPFFTMHFGDGHTTSGPVLGSTFSVVHTYQPGTSFPTTATLKVMDGDGRLGVDTVIVRLRCDPTGDSTSTDADYVSCGITTTATTMTIAVRVVGNISNSSQYRINLLTASTNAQLKYDNGKATGPLSSLVVTKPDPSELDFTFSLAEVSLVSGGQLQWYADAQHGEPGVPSVGFPDRMPDSGSFSFVLP